MTRILREFEYQMQKNLAPTEEVDQIFHKAEVLRRGDVARGIEGVMYEEQARRAILMGDDDIVAVLVALGVNSREFTLERGREMLAASFEGKVRQILEGGEESKARGAVVETPDGLIFHYQNVAERIRRDYLMEGIPGIHI